MSKNGNADASIPILNGSIRIPESYVFDRVHAEPEEVVLVSGTLIEGIGNIHSDLDIYVIVNELPLASSFDIASHVTVCDENDEILTPDQGDTEVGSTYDYYGDSGLHVDVKYITYAEVSRIFETIRWDFGETIVDKKLDYPTVRSSLAKEQEKFVHRLQHGIALTNPEKYEALKAECPVAEYCFLLYRQFSPNYFTFKDVQGTWQAGQLPMAREIARGLVVGHMQSITHLNQNSNKTSKWIFEYVDQLPDWATETRHRFLEFVAMGASNEQESRAYVLAAMDLMDKIFATGVGLMRLQPLYPSPEDCMKHLDAALDLRNDTQHLLSQHAYQFRAKNFRVSEAPLSALVDIGNA
ncbi:MAG: hypothetical protein F4213_08720 [Boseongicola sp. SB0677_bin_26]|nr:hypothetical protein [Boseongicola sp. SB0677_bin_26]